MESRPSASRWKLEDAKARFSQLVREARTHGPQRVTVRRKDAVVVIAADEFDRLLAQAKGETLHELLSNSPLRDLEFPEAHEKAAVRDIVL